MSAKKGRALKIIIGVILVLCTSNMALAEDQEGVYARVNAPSEVTVDSDFTATVEISNLVNFDAGQFDVNFDTTVLRLDNITNGMVGDSVIEVVLLNEIKPGSVRALINILGLPGISGSGHLAVLHFHVIGDVGSSSVIALTNEYINNNEALQIEVEEWADSSVAVVGSGGFSFSIILWIVCGIIGILLIDRVIKYWRRRQKKSRDFFTPLPQVKRRM